MDHHPRLNLHSARLVLWGAQRPNLASRALEPVLHPALGNRPHQVNRYLSVRPALPQEEGLARLRMQEDSPALRHPNRQQNLPLRKPLANLLLENLPQNRLLARYQPRVLLRSLQVHRFSAPKLRAAQPLHLRRRTNLRMSLAPQAASYLVPLLRVMALLSMMAQNLTRHLAYFPLARPWTI